MVKYQYGPHKQTMTKDNKGILVLDNFRANTHTYTHTYTYNLHLQVTNTLKSIQDREKNSKNNSEHVHSCLYLVNHFNIKVSSYALFLIFLILNAGLRNKLTHLFIKSFSTLFKYHGIQIIKLLSLLSQFIHNQCVCLCEH